MLQGNGTYLNLNAGRLRGGGAAPISQGNYQKIGAWRGVHYPDGGTAALPLIGYPTGYGTEGYFLPQTAGYMSMNIEGTGTLTGNLVPSRPMSVDLTGSGTLEATGALVIAMAAALSGSGSLSATIEGRLNMSADLGGSGDLSADMEGIANMAAALLGEGSIDATIAAYGDMSIDIVVTGTGLSTANVGQAVWDFLINGSEAQDLLAAAGSAGDPWITSLPGSYTGAQAGNILGTLLTAIGTRMVENGKSQDEVTRIIFAAIKGLTTGVGTSTETFASDDGLTTRITAEYDTDGNRINIVTDGS